MGRCRRLMNGALPETNEWVLGGEVVGGWFWVEKRGGVLGKGVRRLGEGNGKGRSGRRVCVCPCGFRHVDMFRGRKNAVEFACLELLPLFQMTGVSGDRKVM